MTTPGPALTSPVLGAGANSSVAAMAAVSKQLKALANADIKVVAGTVLATVNQFLFDQTIAVQIDGAPTTSPVVGHTLNGWTPPTGARVLMLLYPPRGVIILGEISNSRLVIQTGSSIAFPGQQYASLQTFNEGVIGGVLYLNDAGGSVESATMTTQYNRDTTTHSGLTSTSFFNIGTSVTALLPASGQIAVWHKSRITGGAATQNYVADVLAFNHRTATFTYGGSFFNGFTYSGVVPTGGTTSGVDISGFVMLGGIGAANIGLLGDLITIQVSYAVSGGTWNLIENAIMVTPSL